MIDYLTFISLQPNWVSYPQPAVEAKLAEVAVSLDVSYLPAGLQPIAQGYYTCHLLTVEAYDSQGVGELKSVENINDTVVYRDGSDFSGLAATSCGRSLLALIRRYRVPGFYAPSCHGCC